MANFLPASLNKVSGITTMASLVLHGALFTTGTLLSQTTDQATPKRIVSLQAVPQRSNSPGQNNLRLPVPAPPGTGNLPKWPTQPSGPQVGQPRNPGANSRSPRLGPNFGRGTQASGKQQPKKSGGSQTGGPISQTPPPLKKVDKREGKYPDIACLLTDKKGQPLEWSGTTVIRLQAKAPIKELSDKQVTIGQKSGYPDPEFDQEIRNTVRQSFNNDLKAAFKKENVAALKRDLDYTVELKFDYPKEQCNKVIAAAEKQKQAAQENATQAGGADIGTPTGETVPPPSSIQLPVPGVEPAGQPQTPTTGPTQPNTSTSPGPKNTQPNDKPRGATPITPLKPTTPSQPSGSQSPAVDGSGANQSPPPSQPKQSTQSPATRPSQPKPATSKPDTSTAGEETGDLTTPTETGETTEPATKPKDVEGREWQPAPRSDGEAKFLRVD